MTLYINIVCDLIIVMTGLWVLFKNPRGHANRYFFMLCFFLAAGVIFGTVWRYLFEHGTVPFVTQRAVHFFTTPIPAALLALVLNYPERRKDRDWMVWLAYLVGFGFGIIKLLGLDYVNLRLVDGFLVYDATLLEFPLFVFFFASVTTISMIILTLTYLRLADPVERYKLKWILSGMWVCLGSSFIFFWALPILFHSTRYGWITNVAISFFAVCTAYSIVKYRALDIETIIHKTAGWLLASVVPLAPVVVVLWVLAKNEVGGEDFFIKSAVVSFFYITFSFYFFQDRIDGLFRRRRHNLSQVVNEFIHSLATPRSTEQLAEDVVKSLQKYLYVRQAAIYLVQKTEPRLYSKRSKESALPTELSLSLHFGTRSFYAFDRDLIETTDPWPEKSGIKYIIPMVANKEILGLILMGDSGRPAQPVSGRLHRARRDQAETQVVGTRHQRHRCIHSLTERPLGFARRLHVPAVARRSKCSHPRECG
jgi:hypothetical protein